MSAKGHVSQKLGLRCVAPPPEKFASETVIGMIVLMKGEWRGKIIREGGKITGQVKGLALDTPNSLL